MSLHDISKDDNLRRLPTPNANDKKDQYMAQGTTQAQNHGAEATADGLKIKERQILAVQDGYEKAAFGFYGNAGKFGLKVAKDGFNATTADDSELIFNSEQNTFKIAKIVEITVPGFTTSLFVTNTQIGSNTVSVPHGLDFTPIAFGFIPFGASYVPLPYVDIEAGGTGGGISGTTYRATANDTDVYLAVSTSAYGPYFGGAALTIPTVTAKIYLLQETAN